MSQTLFIYLSTRQKTKGALAQTLGPWNHPGTYLSKLFDSVATGWPTCLRVVAATASLTKETNTLALGQYLIVTTPHDTAEALLLLQAPEHRLSNDRVTQYQAILQNHPPGQFEKPPSINPSTFLPDDNPKVLIHDCYEMKGGTSHVKATVAT